MTIATNADRHPSARYAFKSRFYRETKGWSATFKVDFDHPLTNAECVTIGEKLWNLEQTTPCVIDLSRIRILRTRKGHHLRVWARRENGNQWGQSGAENPRYYTPHGFLAIEVLKVQVALGDDPKRSDFNRVRVLRGEKNYNVLWNEKWINGRLIMREKLDRKLSAIVANTIRESRNK